MFTELLDGAKRDILAQDSIDHVYADFKSVNDTLVDSEVVQLQTEDNPAHILVMGKIDKFTQPKEP